MEQFEITETDAGYNLTLAPILDFGTAKSLRAYLLGLLPLGKSIALDASQVERMSTPCVQVILAAAKSFEEKNIDFSLSKPTQTFVNAFDDLGLFSVLLNWKIET